MHLNKTPDQICQALIDWKAGTPELTPEEHGAILTMINFRRSVKDRGDVYIDIMRTFAHRNRPVVTSAINKARARGVLQTWPM